MLNRLRLAGLALPRAAGLHERLPLADRRHPLRLRHRRGRLMHLLLTDVVASTVGLLRLFLTDVMPTAVRIPNRLHVLPHPLRRLPAARPSRPLRSDVGRLPRQRPARPHGQRPGGRRVVFLGRPPQGRVRPPTHTGCPTRGATRRFPG